MIDKFLNDDNLVCDIINRLMQEAGIKEAELARQTGLPQTTVNRLLLGATSDPRAHTLKPIADYFGVTIGQLCGFEPFPDNRPHGLTNVTHRNAWQFIPIIDWDEITSWVFKHKNITPFNHKHWIGTERVLSEQSFALKSLAFMQPRFRKGSILIVDPKIDFRDGHFIVIALDSVNPTVRKVMIDGATTLLQPFAQDKVSIPLRHKHRIFGTIVESRINTYE